MKKPPDKRFSCEDCAFFDQRTPQSGICRRSAPVINGWPSILPTEWCGDHEYCEYADDEYDS